jgi:hydrogenase nickel incorporation protein HypA/HybF
MHELSLIESILELIQDAARREGFSRVRVVRLEVGALSCVETSALEFAFESASMKTCAEGARLEMQIIPGLGRCSVCGAHASMEALYDLCPACDGHPMVVLSGTEMRVKDLDVE